MNSSERLVRRVGRVISRTDNRKTSTAVGRMHTLLQVDASAGTFSNLLKLGTTLADNQTSIRMVQHQNHRSFFGLRHFSHDGDHDLDGDRDGFQLTAKNNAAFGNLGFLHILDSLEIEIRTGIARHHVEARFLIVEHHATNEFFRAQHHRLRLEKIQLVVLPHVQSFEFVDALGNPIDQIINTGADQNS